MIAPAAGGPLDLVRDGVTGFLVAPGDGQALADAVATLAADPALRAAAGARVQGDGGRPELADPVRRTTGPLRGGPGGQGQPARGRGGPDGGRHAARRGGGMTTFVALGDSITLGVGDPVRVEDPDTGRSQRAWRGWAALLADGLVDSELHIVAGNGACSVDVERVQLPQALQLRPDIASVVVGVNDTLRPNFDAQRIGTAAAHTIGALRACGAQVLTMRLPDPGRMLGMPGRARPAAGPARASDQRRDGRDRAPGSGRCTSTRPATRRPTTRACGR